MTRAWRFVVGLVLGLLASLAVLFSRRKPPDERHTDTVRRADAEQAVRDRAIDAQADANRVKGALAFVNERFGRRP